MTSLQSNASAAPCVPCSGPNFETRFSLSCMGFIGVGRPVRKDDGSRAAPRWHPCPGNEVEALHEVSMRVKPRFTNLTRPRGQTQESLWNGSERYHQSQAGSCVVHVPEPQNSALHSPLRSLDLPCNGKQAGLWHKDPRSSVGPTMTPSFFMTTCDS